MINSTKQDVKQSGLVMAHLENTGRCRVCAATRLFKFFGRVVVVTNEVLSTGVGVSGPQYASSPFVQKRNLQIS